MIYGKEAQNTLVKRWRGSSCGAPRRHSGRGQALSVEIRTAVGIPELRCPSTQETGHCDHLDYCPRNLLKHFNDHFKSEVAGDFIRLSPVSVAREAAVSSWVVFQVNNQGRRCGSVGSFLRKEGQNLQREIQFFAALQMRLFLHPGFSSLRALTVCPSYARRAPWR